MTPERLLSAWEQGVHRHPIDRALLMLSLTEADFSVDQLADLPLGRCNAALMQLHLDCFGGRLGAWLDCPACSERMEFELNAAQLPPIQVDKVDSIEVDGHRFRLPTSRHLARLVNGKNNAQATAHQLLQDCAESMDSLPDEPNRLIELMRAVEAAVEAKDPWTNIALEVCCPACGREELADFDIASFLWNKIEYRARQLLDDTHLLAQAYGWTESDILEMSEARRRAYLARLQS
jgi:hypothetical protein